MAQPFPMPNLAPMQGPVAGIMQGMQFNQAQDSQRMLLEQMAIEAAQKQAELQRYQGQTPGELSTSRLKGAQAEAQMPYIQDFARGQQGDDLLRAARGQEANATWRTGADSKNEKNLLEGFGAALQRLRVTAAQSPMYAHGEYLDLINQLPKEYRGMFPNAYSPDMVEAQFSKLADTVAQRNTMEQARLQSDTQITVGRGNNAASRYGADQRLSAAYARLPSQTRAKLENVLAEIAEKVAAGKATPQDREVAMWVQSMMYNTRGASQANTIDPQLINLILLGLQGQAQGRGVPQPVAPPGPPVPVPPPGGAPQSAPLGSKDNPIKLK